MSGNGFQHWFQKIFNIARCLGHYWAIWVDEADDFQLPNKKPRDVRQFTLAWDEKLIGIAEPGISLTQCMWEENGRVVYHHESRYKRLRVEGQFRDDAWWEINAYVQRPYPWQPYAARVRYCRYPMYLQEGDCPKPTLLVEYTFPSADRHRYWVQEIVQALGYRYEDRWEVMPDGGSFIVDDERLIIEDAKNLIRYGGLPAEAIVQALQEVAHELPPE